VASAPSLSHIPTAFPIPLSQGAEEIEVKEGRLKSDFASIGNVNGPAPWDQANEGFIFRLRRAVERLAAPGAMSRYESSNWLPRSKIAWPPKQDPWRCERTIPKNPQDVREKHPKTLRM